MNRIKSITLITSVFISTSILSLCGPVRSGLQSQLAKSFEKGWKEIGSTETVCTGFDYFPQGGIRSFACHGANFLTFEELNKAIGPVYKSGPHSDRSLNLKVKGDFGRYNPAFVRKLREYALPARGNEAFRNSTQSVYDSYVKDLARIHFVTYKKIQSLPEWRDREIKNYREAMASNRSYDYEQYFFFMNPNYPQMDEKFLWKNGFDGNFSGNVVKTAVAFWLRRHIDGTAEEFFAGLEEMISIYDEDFLYVEPY